MDIINHEKLKKLQNLFSWNQFYKNSGLSINRWPTELLQCKWDVNSNRLERYTPFNDVINENRKIADKIQEEIKNKFSK